MALYIGGTAVDATAAEINKLDGCAADATELGYCDGVSSAIQTQLNTKVDYTPGRFSAGSHLWTSSDSQVSTNSTGWVVLKTVKIGTGGTFTVSYDMYRSGISYSSKSKLTNGTDRVHNSAVWSTYTENITWSDGQTITLTGHSDHSGATCHFRNFRLYISRVEPYAASWS